MRSLRKVDDACSMSIRPTGSYSYTELKIESFKNAYTSKTGHSKGVRLHTAEFVVVQLAFAVSWQRHCQYSSCRQHFDGRVMMEGHMPF